jgi:hypothetical protein
MRRQLVAFEDAEGGVAVADVQREQAHGISG